MDTIINKNEFDEIDLLFSGEVTDYESEEYKQRAYELEVKWLRENYGENII